MLLNHTQSVILAIRTRGNANTSPFSRLIIPTKGEDGLFSYFFSPHFNRLWEGSGTGAHQYYPGRIPAGCRRANTPPPFPGNSNPRSGSAINHPATSSNNSASSTGGRSTFGNAANSLSGILPRVLLVLEELQRHLFHLSSYTSVGIPTEPIPYVNAFQLYYDDVVDHSDETSVGRSLCGEKGCVGGENRNGTGAGSAMTHAQVVSPSLASSSSACTASPSCSSSLFHSSRDISLLYPANSGKKAIPMTRRPLYGTITDWAVRSSTNYAVPHLPTDNWETLPTNVALPHDVSGGKKPISGSLGNEMRPTEKDYHRPSRSGLLSQDICPLLLLLPFCVVSEYPLAGMTCPAVAFSALISILESRCSFITVEGLKLILQTCLTATKSGCMHAEQLRLMNDPHYRSATSSLFSKKNDSSFHLPTEVGSGENDKKSNENKRSERKGEDQSEASGKSIPFASSSSSSSPSPNLPSSSFTSFPFSAPYPISATAMLFGPSVFSPGDDPLTGAAGGGCPPSFFCYGCADGSNNGNISNNTNNIINSGNNYRGNNAGEVDQKYQELLWSRVAGTFAACFEHPAASKLEECWYVDAARSLLRLPSFGAVSMWLRSAEVSSSSSSTAGTPGAGSAGFGFSHFSSTNILFSSSIRTPLMNSVTEGALKRIIASLFSRVVQRESLRQNKSSEKKELPTTFESSGGAPEDHSVSPPAHSQQPCPQKEGKIPGGEPLHRRSSLVSPYPDGPEGGKDTPPSHAEVNGALMMHFISTLIMGPYMSRETPSARRRRVASSNLFSHYSQHCCPSSAHGASDSSSQETQLIWEDLLYRLSIGASMANDTPLSTTSLHPATLQLEGLFLAQQALLAIPKEWLCTTPIFRPLLHVVQNDLSRALLVVGMHTRYPVVLSLILRTTHLLIQSASEALVPQIYFFLRVLHFWALSSAEEPSMMGLVSGASLDFPAQKSDGSMTYLPSSSCALGQTFPRASSSLSALPILNFEERQERRDIIMESLAYLCAQGDFCTYCYTHYDLSSCYPAVLPQLCDVLLQQVFDPAGTGGGGGGGGISQNGGSSDGTGREVNAFSWNLNGNADTALQAMQVASNFLSTLNEVYQSFVSTEKDTSQATLITSLTEKMEGVKPKMEGSRQKRKGKVTTDSRRASGALGGQGSSTLVFSVMHDHENEHKWGSGIGAAVRMDQAIHWTFKQKNLLIQFANLFAESPMKKGIPFLLQVATCVPSSMLAAQKREQRATRWREKDREHLDMDWDPEGMKLVEEGLESSWLVLAEPAGGREVGECLFRLCPLLDKRALGEYLGEQGDYLTIRPEEDVLVELPSGASISAAELWDAQREQASVEFGTASFFAAQLHGFISQFDFAGRSLLEAIRELVYRVCLPGESQKIDRIMEIFSWYWYDSNPTAVNPALNPFSSDTTAFILSFATIMLNTDLHSGKMHQRMTLEEFRRMNRQVDEGKEVPEEYIRELYEDVKLHEVIMPDMMHKVFLNDVTWNLEMGWCTLEEETHETAWKSVEGGYKSKGKDLKEMGVDENGHLPIGGSLRHHHRMRYVRKGQQKPLRVNFWNVLERWTRSCPEEEQDEEEREEKVREEKYERDHHVTRREQKKEEINEMQKKDVPSASFASIPVEAHIQIEEKEHRTRDGLAKSEEERRRRRRKSLGNQDYIDGDDYHPHIGRTSHNFLSSRSSLSNRKVSLLTPLSQQVLSRYAFVALWRRTLLLFTGIIRGISANGLRGSTGISGGSLRACVEQLGQSGPMELSALLTGLRGCCVIMTTALKLVPEMVDYSYSCLVDVLWWMTDPSTYESGGRKAISSSSSSGGGSRSGSNGTDSTGNSRATGQENSTYMLMSETAIGGGGGGGGLGSIRRPSSLLGDTIALSKHVPCLLCLREIFALLPLVSPYLWKGWVGIAKIILELFVSDLMSITSLPSHAFFFLPDRNSSFSSPRTFSCSLLTSVRNNITSSGAVMEGETTRSTRDVNNLEGVFESGFSFLHLRHALSEVLYAHPLVWSPSVLSSLFLPGGDCITSGKGGKEDQGDINGLKSDKADKQSGSSNSSGMNNKNNNNNESGGGSKWFSGLRNYASQTKLLRDLAYHQEQAQTLSRVRECIPDVGILFNMASSMCSSAHLQFVCALFVCSVPQQLKDSGEIQRFGDVFSLLSALVTERVQTETLCHPLALCAHGSSLHVNEGRADQNYRHHHSPGLSSESSRTGPASSSSSAVFALLESYHSFVASSFPILCQAVQRMLPLDERSLYRIVSRALGEGESQGIARCLPPRMTSRSASLAHAEGSNVDANDNNGAGTVGSNDTNNTIPGSVMWHTCSPNVTSMPSCSILGSYLMPLLSERLPQDSPIRLVRSLCRTVCSIISVLREVLQQWLHVLHSATSSRLREREKRLRRKKHINNEEGAASKSRREEWKEEERCKTKEDTSEEAQRMQFIASLLSILGQVPAEYDVPVVWIPLLEMLAHFLLWNYYDSHDCNGPKMTGVIGSRTQEVKHHSSPSVQNVDRVSKSFASSGQVARNEVGDGGTSTLHSDAVPFPPRTGLCISPPPISAEQSPPFECGIEIHDQAVGGRGRPVGAGGGGGGARGTTPMWPCILGCSSWMHATVNPVLRVLVLLVRQCPARIRDESICHSIGVLLTAIAQEGFYDASSGTAMEEIMEVSLGIGTPPITQRQTCKMSSSPLSPSSAARVGWYVRHLEEVLWERCRKESVICEASYPCIALLHCSHAILAHMGIAQAEGSVGDLISTSSSFELTGEPIPRENTEPCSPVPHSPTLLPYSALTATTTAPGTAPQDGRRYDTGTALDKWTPLSPTSLSSPFLSHWTHYWMLCFQSFGVLAMQGEKSRLSSPYYSLHRFMPNSPTPTSSNLSKNCPTPASPPSSSSITGTSVLHLLAGTALGKRPLSHSEGEVAGEWVENESEERRKGGGVGAGRSVTTSKSEKKREGEGGEDTEGAIFRCVELCLTDLMEFLNTSVAPFFSLEGKPWRDGAQPSKSEAEDNRHDDLLQDEFIPPTTGTTSPLPLPLSPTAPTPPPLPSTRTTTAKTAAVRDTLMVIRTSTAALCPTPSSFTSTSPSPIPFSPAWCKGFLYCFSLVCALYKEALFPLAEKLSGQCSSKTVPPSAFQSLHCRHFTSHASSSSFFHSSSTVVRHPSSIKEEGIPVSTTQENGYGDEKTTALPSLFTEKNSRPHSTLLPTSSSFPTFSPAEEIIYNAFYKRHDAPFALPSPKVMAHFIQLLPLFLVRFLSPLSSLASSPTSPPTEGVMSFANPVGTIPTTTSTRGGEPADSTLCSSSASFLSVGEVPSSPFSSSFAPSPPSVIHEEGDKAILGGGSEGGAEPPPALPSLPHSPLQKELVHDAVEGDPASLSPQSNSTRKLKEGERRCLESKLDSPLFPNLPLRSSQWRLSNDLFNIWKQILTTLHRYYLLYADTSTSSTTDTPSHLYLSSSSTSSSSTLVVEKIENTVKSLIFLVDSISELVAGHSLSSSSSTSGIADSLKEGELLTFPFAGATNPPAPSSTPTCLPDAAYFAGALLTSRVEFWTITLQMASMFIPLNTLLTEVPRRHHDAFENLLGTRI